MPRRPWSPIRIVECGEPLLALPPELLRLEPHPYQSLGAPYGEGLSPFRLRQGVLECLLRAQQALASRSDGWRLAIFDAWRPLAVQAFMVQHAFGEECRRRGLDPHGPDPCLEVRELVARFWADPSPDLAMPPPHSTGAAVDLTLADGSGRVLEMGGAIDALGPESEPDHYALARGEGASWHARRALLQAVMEGTSFVQHPNEWWHFSTGDQLWAWRSGAKFARYGRVAG